MSKPLPTMPIKKAKRYRLLCFIAFLIVDLVTPLIIMGFRFKLFTHFNGYKLTAMGLFALIILIVKFRSKIIERINKWEFSVVKYVVLGINKVMLFIILSAVIHLSRFLLEEMIFVIDWLLVCGLIAYCVITPYEEYFDAIIKREIRKDEMREVMSENKS